MIKHQRSTCALGILGIVSFGLGCSLGAPGPNISFPYAVDAGASEAVLIGASWRPSCEQSGVMGSGTKHCTPEKIDVRVECSRPGCSFTTSEARDGDTQIALRLPEAPGPIDATVYMRLESTGETYEASTTLNVHRVTRTFLSCRRGATPCEDAWTTVASSPRPYLDLAVVGVADNGTELAPSYTAQFRPDNGEATEIADPLHRCDHAGEKETLYAQCVTVRGPGTLTLQGRHFSKTVYFAADGTLRQD